MPLNGRLELKIFPCWLGDKYQRSILSLAGVGKNLAHAWLVLALIDTYHTKHFPVIIKDFRRNEIFNVNLVSKKC